MVVGRGRLKKKGGGGVKGRGDWRGWIEEEEGWVIGGGELGRKGGGLEGVN